MDYISQFDSLFKRKWKELATEWKGRGKDYYKILFVFPNLIKVLNKYLILPKKNLKIADFGCGDGCLTQLIVKYLIQRGNFEKVEIVGIDISSNLLSSFQEKLSRINRTITETYNLDITNHFDIGKKFDLIITSFVFHDIIRIDNLVKNINKHLKINGLHINIMLDPIFSEIMYHKGVLKVLVSKEVLIDDTIIWRKITEFPVITELGKIIYIPHIHRYLGDYINILINNKLLPITIEHFKAENKSLNNYYPFRNNKIYNPEIFQFPSTNLIISKMGI